MLSFTVHYTYIINNLHVLVYMHFQSLSDNSFPIIKFYGTYKKKY